MCKTTPGIKRTRKHGPTTSDGVLVSMVIELREETNWISPGP